MNQVYYSLQDEFFERPREKNDPGKGDIILEPKDDMKYCPNCHSSKLVKNGRTHRDATDIIDFNPDLHDQPPYRTVTILANRFICRNCGLSFSQSFNSIEYRDKITARLKQTIQKNCLTLEPKELSDRYGVSLTTVKNITNEYINYKQKSWRPYLPDHLGMFEAKACGKKVVLCIDLERNGIVDILENSKPESFDKFFEQCGTYLGTCTWIVTDFRICKPLHELDSEKYDIIIPAIGKEFVCGKINNAVSSDIGSVGYGKLRNALRKTYAKTTPEERRLLDEAFSKDERLRRIYTAKERLLAIYAAHEYTEGQEKLQPVYKMELSDCPALKALVDQIRDHEDDVLSFLPFQNERKCSILKAITPPKAVDKSKRDSFEKLRAKWLWGRENAVKVEVIGTVNHSDVLMHLLQIDGLRDRWIRSAISDLLEHYNEKAVIKTVLLEHYNEKAVIKTVETSDEIIPWLQYCDENDTQGKRIIADILAHFNKVEEIMGTYTDIDLLFEE